MMGLLRADLLRMRKRWMVRIVLLILLLIVALILFGIGHDRPTRAQVVFPYSMAAALLFSSSLSSFLWPVIAGNWAGNEYGWGTIRLILARRPSRVAMVLAALTAIMVVVIIGLLLVVLLGAAGGLILGAFTPSGHTVPSDFGATLVKIFLADCYGALFYVLLAYAAGTVFQSAAAGIGLGIGFAVAQTVLSGIFAALGGVWKTAAEHLPEAYLTALPQRLASPDLGPLFGAGGRSGPGVGTAILGIGIYCAILLALTLVVVSRRDVTS